MRVRFIISIFGTQYILYVCVGDPAASAISHVRNVRGVALLGPLLVHVVDDDLLHNFRCLICKSIDLKFQY